MHGVLLLRKLVYGVQVDCGILLTQTAAEEHDAWNFMWHTPAHAHNLIYYAENPVALHNQSKVSIQVLQDSRIFGLPHLCASREAKGTRFKHTVLNLQELQQAYAGPARLEL